MPRTQAFDVSIARIHSPYCEATGPTVKEGFVAARVRALHSLEDQNSGPKATSHSPMTPCPGPKEIRAKKRAKASIFRAVSPNSTSFGSKHPSVLESSQAQAEYSRSDLYLDNTSPTARAGDPIVDSTSDAITTESTKILDPRREILSPRAIPAQMAKPFASWALSGHDDKLPSEFCHPQDDLRQQGSVAEKLGSIVESGWAASSEDMKKGVITQQGLDSPDVCEVDSSFNICGSSALEEIPPHQSTCSHSLPESTARMSDTLNLKEEVPFKFIKEDSSPVTGSDQCNGEQQHNDSKFPKIALHLNCNDIAQPTCRRHNSPSTREQQSARPSNRTQGSCYSGEPPLDSRVPLSSKMVDDQNPKCTFEQNFRDKIVTENDDRQSEGESQFSRARSESPISHISSPTVQMSPKSISRKSSILGDLLTGKWLKIAFVDKKRELQGSSHKRSTTMPQAVSQSLMGNGHDSLQQSTNLEESHEPEEGQGYLAESTFDFLSTDATGTGSEQANIPFYKQWSTPKEEMSPTQIATVNEFPKRMAEEPEHLSGDLGNISIEPRTSSRQDRAPAARSMFSSLSPQALQSLHVILDRDKSQLSVRADGTSLKRKGIKKVKVVVAFGGLDELIIEVKLQKKLQYEE